MKRVQFFKEPVTSFCFALPLVNSVHFVCRNETQNEMNRTKEPASCAMFTHPDWDNGHCIYKVSHRVINKTIRPCQDISALSEITTLRWSIKLKSTRSNRAHLPTTSATNLPCFAFGQNFRTWSRGLMQFVTLARRRAKFCKSVWGGKAILVVFGSAGGDCGAVRRGCYLRR